MQSKLFAVNRNERDQYESIGPGSVLLRGLAEAESALLMSTISAIALEAPFRHMSTPGGRKMSVAMTNCGPWGWVSDSAGYRYSATDPVSGRPWPAMPESFRLLSIRAADLAGFPSFHADACLINRYEPGARMGLHQDKDEGDFSAPIVSVSLGLPAVFQFGGLTRKDRPTRYPLESGDVVVWGGTARLFYHGVAPLAEGVHPIAGRFRFNLTFRKSQRDD